MKKIALSIAAILSAIFIFTTSSQAGYRHYNICWVKTNGTTSCAYLPANYRITGVRKPYCNRAHLCRFSQVSLRLNRVRIRCLSRYINTASMVPGAHAWIYAKAR